VVKKIVDPKLPTEEEIQRHYVCGHIPYRNWCHVCVKAQGRETQHREIGDKERLVPEYSWDYCFPGDEFGFKWTILVGKERTSKSWMATTVPEKGGTGRFAVDKRLEFVQENGDTGCDVLVKSDQEPSMEYLIK
jgi:hypothetical protein